MTPGHPSLWAEAANAAFLLFVVFGSLLWCHRYAAYRAWKRFGEAIK